MKGEHYMVFSEYYGTRADGVKLSRTYSDKNVMIKKNGTDELYSEAIDVENSGYVYSETDIPVDSPESDLTIEDTLSMLSDLGVDTDDN